MSRYRGIAWGCAIATDPDENRINHQRMIDEINEAVAADGWEGVKVVSFFNHCGRATVQVEPGVAPLTLDYLRRIKEAGNSNQPVSPPARPGEQGRLI
jgi:hypothetical protein